MIRKFIVITVLCVGTVFLQDCGAGQRLVSIQVAPATVTFGGVDPALHAQLTATGSYIHPPATKDITSQVTWTSDITQVAQVTSAGVVSPNQNCGVANITASMITDNPKGNEVTTTMAVTVNDPSTPGCPNGTI